VRGKREREILRRVLRGRRGERSLRWEGEGDHLLLLEVVVWSELERI
jgi:hypothetical protein